MEKIIIPFAGLFGGFAFVELTYRLANLRLMPVYMLSLPFKLLMFALVLFACYTFKDVYNFLLCFVGFIFGFFLSLIFRGFIKNGRPEGA